MREEVHIEFKFSRNIAICLCKDGAKLVRTAAMSTDKYVFMFNYDFGVEGNLYIQNHSNEKNPMKLIETRYESED